MTEHSPSPLALWRILGVPQSIAWLVFLCGLLLLGLSGSIPHSPSLITLTFGSFFLILSSGALISRALLLSFIPEATSSSHLVNSLTTTLEHWRRGVDRFSILLDNLAAAVIIRSPSGDITFCSPYTEVLTGYALDEFYGARSDLILGNVHRDDRERCERALKMSEMGEPFQYRFRFFHKSGIELWLEARTVPVFDDKGAFVCSLSVILDVTGLVRYQKQVEERNRDLQDFTYLLSHDLKAPLFTIKGMLSVIDEDAKTPLPQELSEPLSHIKGATDRLERLIFAVLEYAKISAQELKTEPVALTEAIQESLIDHSHRIAESQAIIEFPDSLPVVLGDRLKVTQIFSNLIGNSLKYRDPKRAPHITIALDSSSHPKAVVISITDNGLGIPKEKISSLFRPFVRIHTNEVEGAGIGLASVKKLMERLSGSIDVASVVGEGSTFSLTFRRVE